jgi:hypothetical protein
MAAKKPSPSRKKNPQRKASRRLKLDGVEIDPEAWPRFEALVKAAAGKGELAEKRETAQKEAKIRGNPSVGRKGKPA